MKLYELFDVEFRCPITVFRYDYEKQERIIMYLDEAMYKTVKFLYFENDEVFIEVGD